LVGEKSYSGISTSALSGQSMGFLATCNESPKSHITDAMTRLITGYIE
jgi:hypothetical protein